MSRELDAHRTYVTDDQRVGAFRQALREMVRPGDVVLDLGTGTGILGFLACEAGAARVYAVDEGPIIGLARELARANGFSDRVTYIRDVSTRTMLPELADLAVCDQVGNFGIEAGVFEDLLDARRRLLKPGAATIPREIAFWVAAVDSEDLRDWVEAWASSPAGLDYSPVRTLAVNTGYPTVIDAEQLLSEPASVASCLMPPEDERPIAGTASLTVTRAGTLEGICGWFVAKLSPSVELTNAPGAANRIQRRHVLLPIDRGVPVTPGDRVRVSLRIQPADVIVSWHVEVRRNGSDRLERFTHSTFNGMLISEEDLVRTRPAFVPLLTPAGEARRTILELCDGRRTLREIEELVYARHWSLLPSPRAAAVFVAEVITRYADHRPVD